MSKLRVPAEGLRAGRMVLAEAEGRYIVKVHRQGVGSPIVLFDPIQAVEAEATIVSDRLPEVTLEVQLPVPALVENMPVTVLQALGKADKPEQAVRDATALGAARLQLVTTARTVVRGTKETRDERLLRVAAQVARQCGRGDLPEITPALPLGEAIRRLGPSMPGEARLVCALDAGTRPLLHALGDFPRAPAVVLIGPEGGFSAEEMALARAEGFRSISLGPYVLRMETACSAVLGALRAWAVLSGATPAPPGLPE